MADRLIRPFFEAGSGSGDGGNGGNGDQDPGDQGSGAPGGQGSGTGDQDPKDQMVPASELERVRKEAAKHRTDLRKVEKELEELKKGQMTDLEKAQKEREEALKNSTSKDQENRELRARLIAGNVGIVSAARLDAAKLIDWSQIEDASDDSQIEAALKDLVKDRPYLLGTGGGADGGAGGGQQSGDSGMNSMIRRAAGRT